MRLDSVVFHTNQVAATRDFYESILELRVCRYEKDGVEVEDSSSTYVNFQLGENLLGFEHDEARVDRGSFVLRVEDLDSWRTKLKSRGVVPITDKGAWFKIKDPDGRSIICEQSR